MSGNDPAYTIKQLHKDFQSNSLLAALRAVVEKIGKPFDNASSSTKLAIMVIPLIVLGFYVNPVFDALVGAAAAYAACFLSYVAWYRLVFWKKYIACPHCGNPVSTLECGACKTQIPPMVLWLGGLFLRHCHRCKSYLWKEGVGINTTCGESGNHVSLEEPRLLFKKSTRVIVWVDVDLPSKASIENRGWKCIGEYDDRSLYYRKPRTHGLSSSFPCLLYAVKASHLFETDDSGIAGNEINIDGLIKRNTRLLIVSPRVARKYIGWEDKVHGSFNLDFTAYWDWDL